MLPRSKTKEICCVCLSNFSEKKITPYVLGHPNVHGKIYIHIALYVFSLFKGMFVAKVILLLRNYCIMHSFTCAAEKCRCRNLHKLHSSLGYYSESATEI